MTVTVLPDEVRGKPTGSSGKSCVSGVDLRDKLLRPPPAETVPDEPPNLFGPIDLLFGLADLFQERRRDFDAHDGGIAHGLPTTTTSDKLFVTRQSTRPVAALQVNRFVIEDPGPPTDGLEP